MRRNLIVATLIGSVLTTMVAGADEVRNEVNPGTGTVTITAGGSVEVDFWIHSQNSDGLNGCNASAASPITVSFASIPSDVTANPTSLSFTKCHTGPGGSNDADAVKSVTFSSNKAGNYSVTPTVSGGTGTTTANSLTLVVQASPDTTPPVVTITGPAATGWFNTSVVLTVSVTDDKSGVASLVCTDGGSNTLLSNPAGGTITLGEGIWTVSCSATDNAGNASTPVSSSTYSIDLTAPTVTCVAPAGPFILNSDGTAGLSATVTDALSGALESPVYGNADTSSVGAKTLSLTGYDVAGNSASALCEYSVIFDWAGFFAPVNNLPTFNKAKAGSSIPLKFSLAGDQGLGIFKSGPRSDPLPAATGCSGVGDPVETTATAGSSGLHYDAVADQYVYVWKTEKGWAGQCRSVKISLIDGTTHVANFQFTK